MQLVSVVSATSNTGKTTVLRGMIAEFKRRGLRIATVKHASGSIDLDRPGSDTDQFRRSGSDCVMISGPGTTFRIDQHETEPSLEELLAGLSGFDWVLVEGYKRSTLPKVVVYRAELHEQFPSYLSPVVAVVSDDMVPDGYTRFGFDQIGKLVETVLLTAASDQHEQPPRGPAAAPKSKPSTPEIS